MNILLTGGTGFIGSAVLTELITRGHQVTAPVRSESSAGKVQQAGATALVGDVTDQDWLAGHLAGADAAVHLATPTEGSAADFDAAVVAAVVRAFGGTGKPYVHTGGVWVWGSGTGLSETDAFDAPAITAWRAGVEALVLDADLPATVVAPGIVYGRGGGIPRLIADAPRDEQGRRRLVGDGRQRWTTVHVDDAARLYADVVERREGLGYLLAVGDESPTVRELAEAAAGSGAGVVPESAEETRARLGAPFADALLLDQQASNAKARSLGWAPKEPSLVSQLQSGY